MLSIKKKRPSGRFFYAKYLHISKKCCIFACFLGKEEMSSEETFFERSKKNFRKFYFTYGSITLFAVGLIGVVCLSYWLSRYIPVDVFREYVSPILHGCMLLSAIVGAIVMQGHIDGIRARRTWQLALVCWAIVEVVMIIVERFSDKSTLIYGVETITRGDFIMRDVMAVILLAYPLEVLFPKWLNWWRGALLVLPSIVITALDLVLHEDMRALQIVYPALIAIWLLTRVQDYRARVEDNFSNLENSAIPWLRVYLTILSVIGLSYFYLSFTYHPTRLFTQQWLVLLLLTYNTLQIVCRRKPWQETVIENAEEEEDDDDAVKRGYREKLDAWMETEKPYLNPDFRLVDLMKVLPMNRTYLSKFINVEYDCSFFQFVTKYRIEEAQRLMREHPEMRLQEIAERSGFSSATVFSRTFAKETGLTPTEWMESLYKS